MLIVDAKLSTYTMAAGEPFVLDVRFTTATGAVIDSSAESYALSFYKSNREVVASIIGESGTDAGGQFFRFRRDGQLSESLYGTSGVRVELAERLKNGRNVLADGAIKVNASALGVPSYDNAPVADYASRATFKRVANSADYTIAVAQVPYVELGTVAPTLAALTLSTALQSGTAVSGNILGATVGSTITGNIPGVTINSGARTYSGTPTSEGFYSLVETLAGANGSPRTSGVTVAASQAPSPSPSISFANSTASVSEGNSGTQTVANTINVVRDGLTGALTVNLAYSGTANSSDYSSPTSVTIASGASSVSFDVAINGDTTVEPDETIIITATLAGYSATATKTITIGNDDVAGPTAPNKPALTKTSSTGQPTWTVADDASFQAGMIWNVRRATGSSEANALANLAAGTTNADVQQEVTPQDLNDEGPTTFADLPPTAPGPWAIDQRVGMDDGQGGIIWGPRSDPISGTVIAAGTTASLATVNGVNKNSRIDVTGSPPLSAAMNVDAGAPCWVRTTSTAGSKAHWEYTLTGLGTDGFKSRFGITDAAQSLVDYPVFGSDAPGFSISLIGSATFRADYNGGTEYPGMPDAPQVGDVFAFELDRVAATIVVKRKRGSTVVTIITVTLTSRIPTNWTAAIGGTSIGDSASIAFDGQQVPRSTGYSYYDS